MTAVARGKGEGPTFILVKDQVKLLEYKYLTSTDRD